MDLQGNTSEISQRALPGYMNRQDLYEKIAGICNKGMIEKIERMDYNYILVTYKDGSHDMSFFLTVKDRNLAYTRIRKYNKLNLEIKTS